MKRQKRLGLVYELRTVEDFVALPPSRITSALIDFSAWLLMRQNAQRVKEWDMQPDCVGVFRWVDDGQHVATVAITQPDGTVETTKREFWPEDRA